MIPSVKTIQEGLDVDRATAIKARKLMDGRLNPETFESVESWIRQCYHKPWDRELIMCALDELLEGFGVEAIRREDSQDIVASYINQGDPYIGTVLYCEKRERFLVCCWGDYVERERI